MLVLHWVVDLFTVKSAILKMTQIYRKVEFLEESSAFGV